MSDQDFEIIRVDVSVLGRKAEEVIRVFDDVLIERRAGGDQHGGGSALAAAGAAGALPARSDGARITGHHDRIERTDIDA